MTTLFISLPLYQFKSVCNYIRAVAVENIRAVAIEDIRAVAVANIHVVVLADIRAVAVTVTYITMQ